MPNWCFFLLGFILGPIVIFALCILLDLLIESIDERKHGKR